jgi:hypothetical protein
MMSRKIEQMSREMQMGFQHAEQRLTAVTEKVGTLADSVNTVTALVHNNTIALLDQREERMKRDLLGQLELSIVQADMALMRSIDPTRQAQLREKLESLEQQRDKVRDECESMSSTISTLLRNPPNAAPASLLTPTEPPGLVCNMIPPPPLTSTLNDKPHLLPTPTTSPAKRLAPPHMEKPASPEPGTPTRKRARKNAPIVRRHSMSTRNVSLQVTSQQELQDEDVDEDGDMVIETMAVAVSKIVKLETAPTDGPTHIDTAEQLMMQTSCPKMHLPCVDKTNTSYMLTSARGV